MITKEWLYSKLPHLEPYLLPLVVVLVGLSAFGLGRLSVTGLPATASIAQDKAPYSAESTKGLGNYVASKAGTKYYLPSCAGASNIKEENRVYFVSVAQAQAAGYTAAANCPGI